MLNPAFTKKDLTKLMKAGGVGGRGAAEATEMDLTGDST